MADRVEGAVAGPVAGRVLVAAAVVVIAVALVATGCGGAGGRVSEGGGDGRGAGRQADSLTVFAAASLAEVLPAVDRRLAEADGEESRPPTRFAFAGSATLVAQVVEGAPADVVVTADHPTMERLVAAGALDGLPSVLARNRLAIVVARGNPRRVRGLADLARPDLAVVLGAPSLPAGQYARQALAKAGVQVRASSLDDDVRAVVTKVALGEADAGVVYATDVVARRERVSGVEIPDDQNVTTEYLVAVTGSSRDRDRAHAWVRRLGSAEARRVLAGHGFLPP